MGYYSYNTGTCPHGDDPDFCDRGACDER